MEGKFYALLEQPWLGEVDEHGIEVVGGEEWDVPGGQVLGGDVATLQGNEGYGPHGLEEGSWGEEATHELEMREDVVEEIPGWCVLE